jgi:dienelactone hydrolase
MAVMQREDVWFNSGSDRINAWLYRPDGDGDKPLLVMAHGLGAVRTMRLDAYAERFAAAGYACLVFDYRNFGDSEGAPRQLLDVKMQLQDWTVAAAFARTLPGIDPKRIGLWGTSFSGGHVIATAARLTALAVRDIATSRFGGNPVMVKTAGHPGEIALMSSPDAYPGYLKLVPEGAELRNEVAARIGVKLLPYRPGRHAAQVPCPILFCICETDTVAPSGPTKKYAAMAPKGEIKLYPEGHFEIYVGDAFERVIADQLEFLARVLPAS